MLPSPGFSRGYYTVGSRIPIPSLQVPETRFEGNRKSLGFSSHRRESALFLRACASGCPDLPPRCLNCPAHCKECPGQRLPLTKVSP